MNKKLNNLITKLYNKIGIIETLAEGIVYEYSTNRLYRNGHLLIDYNQSDEYKIRSLR